MHAQLHVRGAAELADGLAVARSRPDLLASPVLLRLQAQCDVQIIDVSVIKATNHNKVPPKSKHVQGAQSLPALRPALYPAHPRRSCSSDRPLKPPPPRAVLLQNMSWAQSARYVNRCLVNRAHNIPKWLVVLKVCITHHRLLRESRGQYAAHLTNPAVVPAAFSQPGLHGAGHPYPAAAQSGALPAPGNGGGPGAAMGAATGALQATPSYGMQNDACPPLGLRSFRDGSSKKAFDLSTFIRFYAAYLDMQLDVFSKTKYIPVNIPGTEPPLLKCGPPFPSPPRPLCASTGAEGRARPKAWRAGSWRSRRRAR